MKHKNLRSELLAARKAAALIGEEFRRFKHHILRGVLQKTAYTPHVDEVLNNTNTAVLVLDFKQKVNPRQHKEGGTP